MGLNYYLAREVLRARPAAPFSAATIGRLQQFLLPAQCIQLCEEFGLEPTATWVSQPYGDYGEPFLAAAGAAPVVSVDASDYEGAALIHDMNIPVGDELCERFDLVVDGGTMEHVFAPPVALANMMKMLKVGGSLIIWSPANNLCGHGFYQFSPEFFYSSLTESRGFKVQSVAVVDCVFPSVSLVAPKRAYAVQSPQAVRRRVEILSRRPLMLLTRAVKQAHLDEPFATAPQQSDYVAAWGQGESDDFAAGARARALKLLRASARGRAAARWLQGVNERRVNSLHNRSFFTPE